MSAHCSRRVPGPRPPDAPDVYNATWPTPTATSGSSYGWRSSASASRSRISSPCSRRVRATRRRSGRRGSPPLDGARSRWSPPRSASRTGRSACPLTLVRGYWLPRRFGLLHQPLRAWLADRAEGGADRWSARRSRAVELVYVLLERTALWWLVAAAVFVAVQIVLTAVLPDLDRPALLPADAARRRRTPPSGSWRSRAAPASMRSASSSPTSRGRAAPRTPRSWVSAARAGSSSSTRCSPASRRRRSRRCSPTSSATTSTATSARGLAVQGALLLVTFGIGGAGTRRRRGAARARRARRSRRASVAGARPAGARAGPASPRQRLLALDRASGRRLRAGDDRQRPRVHRRDGAARRAEPRRAPAQPAEGDLPLLASADRAQDRARPSGGLASFDAGRPRRADRAAAPTR